METLSNILASFDIFQVIIGAFPRIFSPVVHAFQGMFITITDVAGKQFETHPGLISGTILFLILYAAWSGISTLRRNIVAARTTSPNRSR